MLRPRGLAQQHLDGGLTQFEPIGLMAGQARNFFASATQNTHVFGDLYSAVAKFFNDRQGKSIVEAINRGGTRDQAGPVLNDLACALFGQFHENLPGATPTQAAFAQGLAVTWQRQGLSSAWRQ